jgi:hypothetical protein
MLQYPIISDRPVYTLTKLAGTLYFQLTAQHTSPETMQVINYYPGTIYSKAWERAGVDVPREFYDSGKL